MDSAQHFTANGKLLLFGEYLVLRGASCLAIPLKYNQRLRVSKHEGKSILWGAKNNGEEWLFIHFSDNLSIIHTTDIYKAEVIQKLLRTVKELNPTLDWNQLHFCFDTNFERNFGFGTSSTLIALLSQWAAVDPYTLLEKSFGGSGYDIAAATASLPFVYTVEDKITQTVQFAKAITDNLLFVYLGAKQDSSREISKFKTKTTTDDQLKQINSLINEAVSCQSIEYWEKLMLSSENLLAEILEVSKVKDHYFCDYPFAIKSLGAWGGDFIMATHRDLAAAKEYFNQKGYTIQYTYNELIK